MFLLVASMIIVTLLLFSSSSSFSRPLLLLLDDMKEEKEKDKQMTNIYDAYNKQIITIINKIIVMMRNSDGIIFSVEKTKALAERKMEEDKIRKLMIKVEKGRLREAMRERERDEGSYYYCCLLSLVLLLLFVYMFCFHTFFNDFLFFFSLFFFIFI